MLLAVVLLYVGAVLGVNGIWLIGQARAVEEVERVSAHAGAAAEPLDVSSSVGGRGAEPAPARREGSPLFLQNREVAVINIFTGFIGVVIALIFLVQGAVGNDLAAVRGGGFILLFAFTYLWVAFNQYLDAGGRAFGWYCLFVAITAIPAGIYTLQNANGNVALIWLGVNWFLWAILWGLFWALLALELPIARPTGWVTIIEGIGTAWALGFAVLIGVFSF
ncbi:AmiS/UreI family transporter [Pseudonocardia sp. RS11V-5]|uniref:AmiS/UreI family transporter n=1 Tax=Pseudonocardia terrae TaxID=2905831 RepID=UPI001E4B1E36|nr:AmiS/UreI family transporter [Pseudonocardia terrae]MCE3554226.1 AmiS/UreI family transporter [Pseudonocardia terrae]